MNLIIISIILIKIKKRIIYEKYIYPTIVFINYNWSNNKSYDWNYTIHSAREERSLIAEKKSYVYEHSDRNPATTQRDPPSRRRQRRHLISISHPRGPFLIQTARAEALSLSPSRKDYMPEKLHTFLMATHGCSPAPVPSTLRPGKCVRTSGEAGNGEVQGENTRHEEKGRREARAKEPSVTPATSVIYLLPPPPPSPRLFFFSCDFARGVIFQRTGKCSHYREKPCGAPARRCTITRQPSVRERRQPVAQTENHARWRTTFPQALAWIAHSALHACRTEFNRQSAISRKNNACLEFVLILCFMIAEKTRTLSFLLTCIDIVSSNMCDKIEH